MTSAPARRMALPFALLLASSSPRGAVESFSPSPTTHRLRPRPPTPPPAAAATTARGRTTILSLSEAALPLPTEDDDEDDEMEWVEEEFELLTERDFYNTEWKMGTIMDDKPREAGSIETTWVRLITTEDGENKAIWGDDSKGKWTIDVPSQFFSISKETFGGWLGKRIWAGTIDDFYFLEGTVRGWSPISPASVVGQWQGVRLGVVDGERVSAEERGTAPWFAKEEDEGEKESEGDEESEESEEDEGGEEVDVEDDAEEKGETANVGAEGESVDVVA